MVVLEGLTEDRCRADVQDASNTAGFGGAQLSYAP